MNALTAAGLSQSRALILAGVARSTWHYRTHPRPRAASPLPQRERGGVHWLTGAETASVVAMVMTAFTAGRSVYQAFYEALDAGKPVASLATWYRIARIHAAAGRPVRRRRGPPAGAPELTSSAPMQLWSWDITKLAGPLRGMTFEFYVVIDVFSRKIVGWRVEEREDHEMAADLFRTAFAAEGARPAIVHADRGSAMRSNTLRQLFHDLHVTASYNRPRVSDDNPYSESLFKTAKYAPGYPPWFDTLDQARAWATTFVTWYNTEHRHSSLEGHTPASVHDGTWREVHHTRQAAMDHLYAARPARFTSRPTLKAPRAQSAINQPKTQDRLQTG